MGVPKYSSSTKHTERSAQMARPWTCGIFNRVTDALLPRMLWRQMEEGRKPAWKGAPGEAPVNPASLPGPLRGGVGGEGDRKGRRMPFKGRWLQPSPRLWAA